MQQRLLFIGYGNVSRALVRMLAEKAEILREQYGLTFAVAGIYTRSTGGVTLPDMSPVDLNEVGWPYTPEGGNLLAPIQDVFAFIRGTPADVVLELTTLNPYNGQPAL